MSCDKVEIQLQLTATMTELLMAVSTLLMSVSTLFMAVSTPFMSVSTLFRYFKGDIVMASVDGHGTDTYVYLQVGHMSHTSHISPMFISKYDIHHKIIPP